LPVASSAWPSAPAVPSREVSAAEALRLGLVADVVPDARLAEVAETHAAALAQGATRAHAVTKSILGAWSSGGVRAADEVMIEQVSVLLATDDVQRGVASAIPALESGAARPPMMFNGQ
jgi:enoyl-CoA hydratase/carnithine racemase